MYKDLTVTSATHSLFFLTKHAVPLRRSRMKPRLGRIIPAPIPTAPPLRWKKKIDINWKNSRTRAFPPSGRCSPYGTGSLSADARSHVQCRQKCCFLKPKQAAWSHLGCPFSVFFLVSPIPCLSQISCSVRNPSVGCYHPCNKNKEIPAQTEADCLGSE